MANIETNASPPRAGEGRGESLALRLLELAIKAGWKPHECIEFAREAYKLITPTLPEAATGLVASRPEPETKLAASDANEAAPPARATAERLKWNSDPESRRKALQALADKNLMMKEAAEILGVSRSMVASAAHKLKIRFHGRANRRPRLAAAASAKRTNGAPASNGASVMTLLVDPPVDRRMKRRCPACNQIFEPAAVSDYLCHDCESNSH